MSRAEEMRELFARWKSSGLSLMAFGKAERVPYSQLLYWRRKLGAEAREASESSRVNSPSELMPVRIVPDSPPIESSHDKFEVWLSNGISLDVAAGFDERELKRLVGALLTC